MGLPELFPRWSRRAEAPRPPSPRRPADRSWRRPGASPPAAGAEASLGEREGPERRDTEGQEKMMQGPGETV